MKNRVWFLLLFLAAIFGAVAVWFHDPSGPTSRAGYQSRIEVSDSLSGPGADHYADVVILNPHGIEISRWKDPDGQKSNDGIRNLIQSMRWSDDRTLEFRTHAGEQVKLTAPSSSS